MKEIILGISEFKSKRLGLLDVVAKGNTLIITKRGRPIPKVLPVKAPVRSLRGSWKGIVKINGDVVKCNEAAAWKNG